MECGEAVDEFYKAAYDIDRIFVCTVDCAMAYSKEFRKEIIESAKRSKDGLRGVAKKFASPIFEQINVPQAKGLNEDLGRS
ncbi:MAG: hypothetical protein LBE95_03110 [Holosporaceae bacterium]|jgi:hypothetical protein|nr:hypothetical protein [Holosporaceae bacterium]